MLSAVPGKSLGGVPLTVQGDVSIKAHSKVLISDRCYFHFSPFIIKAKILFRILLFSKNRD